MATSSTHSSTGSSRRYLIIIAILVAVAVFVTAMFSIRRSRADSFRLLVLQGTAFTEALAQASENTIVAESFYDRLVQSRYGDLAATLAEEPLEDLTDSELMRFARVHDLFGVFIYGMDSALVRGGVVRGPLVNLPEFVTDEVAQLIASPEANFVLLLDDSGGPGETVHYYLELSNRLDRVVVLAVDALYYDEALRQTGIGYLAQNMAREQGVEYIIYQANEGIIFSSRKPGNLLAIESDPFLLSALDGDTISSREYEFQGKHVLELVRPFATEQYPFGVFRVGLSLDGFYSVSRGFDRQMAVISVVLFGLLLVAILYINVREKRRELKRRYTRMKSLTDKIFEQMQTGVAVVDRRGEVRLVNDAFENIFAVSETQGKPFVEVVSSDVISLDRYFSGTVGADETEIELPSDSGRRTLLVAVSAMGEEGHHASDVLLVVYDVTRLREFERAAARKERLSEMGNLAAGVAHEIRNPLNTISIAVQRLAGEFVPKENHEEYLSFTEKIRSETRRLNEIITRFLALARDERRKQTSVDLGKLIEDVAGLLRVEAEKLGLDLVVESDVEAVVEGDPDRLKELFLNLFNNAKEAIGGQSGSIHITAHRDGDMVRVLFGDSGPGVDPGIREEVLKPYFTTKEGGTGLGLPTVHRIVSEIGGEISIGQSPLGGAEFVLSFPVKSDQ